MDRPSKEVLARMPLAEASGQMRPEFKCGAAHKAATGGRAKDTAKRFPQSFGATTGRGFVKPTADHPNAFRAGRRRR